MFSKLVMQQRCRCNLATFQSLSSFTSPTYASVFVSNASNVTRSLLLHPVGRLHHSSPEHAFVAVRPQQPQHHGRIAQGALSRLRNRLVPIVV